MYNLQIQLTKLVKVVIDTLLKTIDKMPLQSQLHTIVRNY